jgi:hypothetical protein
VSIWFWGAGIALLQTSVIAHVAYLLIGSMTAEIVALIAFALFALAVILGMMGKIVPFLVWFHLSSQGFMDAPIMSNIIPVTRLKITFLFFAIAALFALASPLYPATLSFAGVMAAVLFAVVLSNLVGAWKLYRHTLAHGTRFEQV